MRWRAPDDPSACVSSLLVSQVLNAMMLVAWDTNPNVRAREPKVKPYPDSRLYANRAQSVSYTNPNGTGTR